MKKILITILLSIFIGFNISGQTTYFNNHFSYNNKFTIAPSIAESGNNYMIIGTCVHPTYPTRAIGFWTLDISGAIQQTKVYGSPDYESYSGYYGASHPCTNSGFSLAGAMEYPLQDSAIGMLYRFSGNGDTIWTKKYDNSYDAGISDWAGFYNHIETVDQGFTLLGVISLPGSYNQGILVVRTDSLGNELWRKVISTYNRMDIAYNIINTPDSGFVIGAYQYLAGNNYSGDAKVYKLDKQGNLEWTRTYGSQWNDWEARVILTRDSNILITYGEAYDCGWAPTTEIPEVVIVKVSLTGQQIWKRNYRQYRVAHPNAIIQGHDGYVIAGRAVMQDTLTGLGGYVGFVFKIDENGDSIWWRNHWNQPINQGITEQNVLYDITTTSDGGYIACGETSSAFAAGTLGYQHGWVLKMDEFGCQNAWCTSGVQEIVVEKGDLKVYPNPAHDYLIIDYLVQPENKDAFILITDSKGGLINKIELNQASGQHIMNCRDLQSGLYYISLITNKNVVLTKKVTIAK